MKSKIMPIIIIGVALAILAVFLSSDSSEPQIDNGTFSYESNLVIKEQLQKNSISMSTPLTFKGDLVSEYCTFFKDSTLQNQIQYCTSTELKDSEENFLGNIHMVGNLEYPQMAMAIIQTDPYISEYPELDYIFKIMIETLVCNCWEEKKPGNFASISDWIQQSKEYHQSAQQITSKSVITNLTQQEIVLEITTNDDGYLWKLLIDQ